MRNVNDLRKWITEQQSGLDSLIAAAAKDFFDNEALPNNFAQYDLPTCQNESFNLIEGKDLCYDRPLSAFTYSLWYHPKRLNLYITCFADALWNSKNKDEYIQIFDLGAGTGAVQWAVGLVYAGMKACGLSPPRIKVVNVDTSGIMLDYHRSYLWKHFLNKYPVAEAIATEYDLNSWNCQDQVDFTNIWFIASYLFDVSDKTDFLTQGFKDLTDRHKPNKILIATSQRKANYLQEIAKSLASSYKSSDIKSGGWIFTGRLNKVTTYRKSLLQEYPAKGLENTATWQEQHYSGIILEKKDKELSSPPPMLSIHDIPKPRKDIILNEQQKAAARLSNTRTIITGPAGCGKSIVITEKIYNVVEKWGYNPSLKILLSTFNKALIAQLADWLEELLFSKKEKVKRCGKEGNDFQFQGSDIPNIRLLHFDVLPTRLGGLHNSRIKLIKDPVNESEHIRLLQESIKEIKQKERLSDERYDYILNPKFLWEEFKLVVYGLKYATKDTYLKEKRHGRGTTPRLKSNSYERL